MSCDSRFFRYCSICALFLIPFFVLFMRVNTFPDESVAIINGDLFLRAFFGAADLKRRAAYFDGYNGIGLFVCMLAGLMHRLTHDLAWTRGSMVVWNILYTCSLLFFFDTVMSKIKKPIFSSSIQRWIAAFTFACLVEDIQGTYWNTALPLSEIPGAAFVFFGLAMFLREKAFWGLFLFGVAVTFKVNYFLYFPFVILIGAVATFPDLKSLRVAHLKWLCLALLCYWAFPAFVQLMRLICYGWEHYWGAWKYYVHWIQTSSGAGFGAKHIRRPDEWDYYVFRMRAQLLLGTFAPLSSLVFVSFFNIFGKRCRLGIAIFSAAVLLASAQWFFMAEYRWWRRTYYFMLPGYGIGCAILLILVYMWTQSLKWRHLVRGAFLTLAIFLQTYVSTWIMSKQRKIMNYQERTTFDWNNNFDWGEGPWAPPGYRDRR